jgi:hypothetical protein
MAKKKPITYHFRTVEEMHAIPMDKLDNFCRDLSLWLMVHRIADANSTEDVKIKSGTRDVFGWIDDCKHDVRVNIKVKSE